MRRTRFSVFGVVVAICALSLAPASAGTIITFSGTGGTVSAANGHFSTSTPISIASVTIAGAPDASKDGSKSVSSGSLNFDTRGAISLWGAIPDLGVGAQYLLQGTISDFSSKIATTGGGFSVYEISAIGVDTKSPDLLTRLGLNPATPFELFAFSLWLPLGGSGPALTTSVVNTSVPEPGSLLLLGSALGGVGLLVRRLRSDSRIQS